MKGKPLASFVLVSSALLLFASGAAGIAPFYTGDTTVTAGSGINGTVHDLRRANMAVGYKSIVPDPLDRLCIFCHAPHHTYRLIEAGTDGTGPLATADYTYLPLWNHTITLTVFTQYDNGPDEPDAGSKRSQARDNFGSVGSSSLLCLSCHDGTIAVNEYGHYPQTTKSRSAGGPTIALQYSIGNLGYLGNHHPIGFLYDDVAALDPDIYNSAYGVFDQTLDGGTAIIPIANMLWRGRLECTSCHSVHNKGNTGEKLLYVSDKNSNLCLSCHNKGFKDPIIAPY